MLKIEQNIKDIPELKIGDGKLNKRVDFKYHFENLKNWWAKLIINF